MKNIFRKLHTLSAKQRLTAGPAKLHSQIFYLYGSRIYWHNIHALNRRVLHRPPRPRPPVRGLTAGGRPRPSVRPSEADLWWGVRLEPPDLCLGGASACPQKLSPPCPPSGSWSTWPPWPPPGKDRHTWPPAAVAPHLLSRTRAGRTAAAEGPRRPPSPVLRLC